ncbi:hypothetical protein [Kitasatospora sp. NPDC058046]|uniref:hypothetical protein n=1 Tax=Kitasatospora sp. NPDC058046 TaxID=3346312 RepID=UPI0036D7E999
MPMKTPPALRPGPDIPEPAPQQRAQTVHRYQASESLDKLRRELGVPESRPHTRLDDRGMPLHDYAEAKRADQALRRRTR